MSTKGKTWTVYGRKGSSSSHESKTRLYRIWIDMKSRCLNPNCWYGRVKVNGNNCYTGSSTNIHEAAKMRNEYIISHNLPNRKNVIREEVVV